MCRSLKGGSDAARCQVIANGIEYRAPEKPTLKALLNLSVDPQALAVPNGFKVVGGPLDIDVICTKCKLSLRGHETTVAGLVDLRAMGRDIRSVTGGKPA